MKIPTATPSKLIKINKTIGKPKIRTATLPTDREP